LIRDDDVVIGIAQRHRETRWNQLPILSRAKASLSFALVFIVVVDRRSRTTTHRETGAPRTAMPRDDTAFDLGRSLPRRWR
jgi:hypothetical protein